MGEEEVPVAEEGVRPPPTHGPEAEKVSRRQTLGPMAAEGERWPRELFRRPGGKP